MLATIAVACAPAARALPGSVGKRLPVCVTPARPGDTAAAMWRATSRYRCVEEQEAFGAGDFWVRSLAVPAGAGVDPVVLRSTSLWQRAATIRLRYADGAITTFRMDDLAAARSLRLGAFFEYAVPVRGVPVTAILWQVEGSTNVRGIVGDPRLATLAQAEASQTGLAALYAAFAGLGITLLIYNAALWSVLRHRFQLAYCAMTAALLGYALTSSGALAFLWPALGNTDRIRINYLSLMLVGVSVLAFARWFFEPKIIAGWPHRLMRLSSAALIATCIAFVLLAPWQARTLDCLHALSFTALIMAALVVLVQAYRRGSNHLWLFALAWALPIAFAALRLAASLKLVPDGFLVDNAMLFAMSAEAILSAVAIVYRLRLLTVERDEARVRVGEALQLANTDSLTGLMNRRAFLREAIGSAGLKRLLVLDIDHFKNVNDTLGHDGGDEVLRRFARALRDAAPPGALVARLGGEEFAILAEPHHDQLPDATLAAIRAERMPFDLSVTASLGNVLGLLESEADWSRLYRAADAALYAAKAAGRDRVRHADLCVA